MSTFRKSAAAAAWAMTALVAANMAWAAPAPTAAPAAAKPMEVAGKIRAIDVVNQVIKMENGQYFVVPSTINLQDLKGGDQIVLTGEKDQNGNLAVKTVVKAK